MELATVDAEVSDNRSIFVFSKLPPGSLSLAGLSNKCTDLYRADRQLRPWAVGTSHGGRQYDFSAKMCLVPVQSIKE